MPLFSFVMITFLHNFALFWVKNANFFAKFLAKILKNHNIVTRLCAFWAIVHSWQFCLQIIQVAQLFGNFSTEKLMHWIWQKYLILGRFFAKTIVRTNFCSNNRHGAILNAWNRCVKLTPSSSEQWGHNLGQPMKTSTSSYEKNRCKFTPLTTKDKKHRFKYFCGQCLYFLSRHTYTFYVCT
jgi:hypothetical protein